MAAPRVLDETIFREHFVPGTLHAGAKAGSLRHPGVRVSLWVIADVFSIGIASILAIHFRHTYFVSKETLISTGAIGHHTVPLLAMYLFWFAVLVVIVSRSYGLYGPLVRCSGMHEQRMTVQACFTAGLLLAGTLYLAHAEVVSRLVVLLTVFFSMLVLCVRRACWRFVIYKRNRRGLEVRNILIVGTGQVSQLLRSHLEAVRHLGLHFKGYVQFSPADREAPSHEILGSVNELITLARTHFVDEIFVATPCERGMVKKIVSEAAEAGVDVRVIPDLYDGLAWNAPIEYLGQFPTIPLHRRELPVAEQLAKRVLDVFVSSVGLLVLSPLLAIIALWVKFDSDGSVFYAAERIGKKGHVFRCYKFRTMVKDAETRKADLFHMNERDGLLFKIKNDPRVTPFGRFLRKYSLDELPQLYNVLKGDMSLVGPRPPVASEVQKYELIHLRRLAVSPGITGLWQVEARQDPSFDSYISLDTAYVENWSLWLDVKILIRTIAVVLAGTGT